MLNYALMAYITLLDYPNTQLLKYGPLLVMPQATAAMHEPRESSTSLR